MFNTWFLENDDLFIQISQEDHWLHYMFTTNYVRSIIAAMIFCNDHLTNICSLLN